MPTVSKTAAEAGQQITRDDYEWGTALGAPSGPISYAFRETAPAYNNSHGVQASFSQFSASQIQSATLALQLWSDIANVSFVRVGEGESGPAAYSDDATILFANYSASNDGAAAFAYYPDPDHTDAASLQGDVWVNRYFDQSSYTPPTYRFMTLMHELGHALGLEHPGDYNAGPGVAITYANNAEYIEDTRQYSIMSYFSASNTGAYHGEYYAQTPLMHDIVALQRLYGANMDTRTGDTVYGFNSNADRDVFHLNSNVDHPIFCIWDAGGIDTLDLSGFSTNQVLDLEPGTFSNAGNLTKNISIAPDVVIENGIGGSGNDRIIGNDAANRLFGKAGNDTIIGGEGDDFLSGGAGKDWLEGGVGADRFQFNSLRQRHPVDVILDFNPGEGDLIDVSPLDAKSHVAGNQAFRFIDSHHFSKHAGELRFAHGVLQGDIDGDGRLDFKIAVHFYHGDDGSVAAPGPLHLTVHDLLL